MKKLLVGTGREGQWAGFLRGQRIPLSSANRLVRHHEALLQPDQKMLTEQLSEAEMIDRVVKAILPRARKVLTDPNRFQQFVRTMANSVGSASVKEVEKGLLVLAGLAV